MPSGFAEPVPNPRRTGWLFAVPLSENSETMALDSTLRAKTSRILIAGGGIGGLATALALQRLGFNPTVCERAPGLKEVGAGLLLSPNGVHALDWLGLREKATARSRVITEWRILNRSGRCLVRLRPTRANLPALSLHRSDLQFLLAENVVPTSLRLGCAVRTVEQRGGEVEVVLGSGEKLSVDAVIGADGLRSAVRAARFGEKAPTYSGYVGWRGVSPWIPPDYQGEALSESWGEGKRFGIAPMGNGRCYWYATATRREGSSEKVDDRHEELLRLFGHWHAPVSALIESTPSQQIVVNDIYDRPAQHPWSDRAITLLGDAAHPMTPNLGQGACFALEDACVLSTCVAASRDFKTAFAAYERTRRSRADSVQRRSRWLGKVIQLESRAATTLRDLLLRSTPNGVADLSMRPLFSFKL